MANMKQIKDSPRAGKPVDEGEMAVSASGVKLMIVGLIVLVSGLILLSGGGSDDPQVFNWEMFNFTRMVAAPVLLVLGIIIEIVAVMKRPRRGENE